MKVLFATCAAWLLHKAGERLLLWGIEIETWAGIDIRAGGTD